MISGVLSRAVLTGVELKFDLPEHIFAEQPVLAEIELRNEKQMWPSFSLRVVGEGQTAARAKSCRSRYFFPYIPRMSSVAAESGSHDFRAAAFTSRIPSASARDSLSDSSRKRGQVDSESGNRRLSGA